LLIIAQTFAAISDYTASIIHFLLLVTVAAFAVLHQKFSASYSIEVGHLAACPVRHFLLAAGLYLAAFRAFVQIHRLIDCRSLYVARFYH
jgi:hypothetical protein